MATLAWLGHGAATEGPGRWLHLVADIVHVLAAALWLGALAAFWLMLSRRSARATDAAMFHQALKGFSGLGTLAVGLLTASGLVNTTFTVGMANLRLAPDTAYGQLLIVKLVLFGLMLVLAASNRFALTPALGRSLQTVDARMASLGRLKRSVILESVVGAALVAVVAILGIQPPPGSGF
ncbi:CopD family protein [Brevundimonas aurantiaca]|uniref:CopD family protein n=1 Tax=Brevundimonas aurantiaca TaxID=74316 RepID=UPI0003630EB9